MLLVTFSQTIGKQQPQNDISRMDVANEIRLPSLRICHNIWHCKIDQYRYYENNLFFVFSVCFVLSFRLPLSLVY